MWIVIPALCTCQCQHKALNNALENKYYKTQDAITGHILISLENSKFLEYK